MSRGDSRCPSPLTFETLVSYWAHDLTEAETEAVDAHVFSCASCTELSQRIAAITEALRAQVPPFVSHAKVDELRARGLDIEQNTVSPGGRLRVTFDTQDILIHRLVGLDLTSAARVAISVRVEETNDLIVENPRVPFDADSGEVLVACHRHFASFPPNIVFEVTAVNADGRKRVERYTVEHAFV